MQIPLGGSAFLYLENHIVIERVLWYYTFE